MDRTLYHIETLPRLRLMDRVSAPFFNLFGFVFGLVVKSTSEGSGKLNLCRCVFLESTNIFGADVNEALILDGISSDEQSVLPDV